MPAKRVLGAVGCLCIAASTAMGQPGMPAPMPAAGMPAGPGMAAPGGAPGMMQAPGAGSVWPGNPAMMTQPDWAPTGPTQNPAGPGGEVPGIPQAWAMSCFNPAPSLVIHAEALLLKTEYTRSRTLAIQPTVNGAGQFVLANRDIGPNTQYLVTPRLMIEKYLNDRFSLEVGGYAAIGPHRTFSLGTADFPYFLSGNFAGAAPFTGPITPTIANFPTTADQANISMNQNLGNVELMGWWHWTPDKGACSDLALGIGGRYMFLNEKYDLTFVDQTAGAAAPTGSLNVRSKNDLFGVQLGGRAIMQSPFKRIRSVAECRLGLMNDDARHNTSVVDAANTTVLAGRYGGSNFSFLVDASYNLEIFVTQYVTAYAGFQVFYVDRVERATEQFNPDLNAFVAPQKQQSDLLMFGPKVGFVMTW